MYGLPIFLIQSSIEKGNWSRKPLSVIFFAHLVLRISNLLGKTFLKLKANISNLKISFLTDENLKTPVGTTINETAVQFVVHQPHLTGVSGFGAIQSYKLVVWGPDLPETTIDIPSNGQMTHIFSGLNIWSIYWAYAIFEGSNFITRSKKVQQQTAESCKIHHFVLEFFFTFALLGQLFCEDFPIFKSFLGEKIMHKSAIPTLSNGTSMVQLWQSSKLG